MIARTVRSAMALRIRLTQAGSSDVGIVSSDGSTVRSARNVGVF